MAISLVKGGNISLTKDNPNLSKVVVGLGWDARATDGAAFDLDASAFMVGQNGKVRSDADFIFYKQLSSVDGSVQHTGDNRTGDGDGDDESINIDLSRVPMDVACIVIGVSIHDAVVNRQNFGQVQNAFIRIVDAVTGMELTRFDLNEDFSTETAVIFANVYRHNGEWKFKAVGQGYANGLTEMGRNLGVNIA